ncbi:hypothetical protein [Lysobacter sp. A289]
MTDTIKIAVARELADSGSIKGVEILGLSGGYSIFLRLGNQPRQLGTKSGDPRIFSSVDAATRVLRELGLLNNINLNLADYSPDGRLARPRRPDRANALRHAHEAAAHDTWFRDQVRATRQRLATGDGKLTEHDTVFADLRAYASQLEAEK